MNKPLWRQRLYQHYTANSRQVFQQFKLGSMLFFLGLVVIYSAHNLLSESLTQEIIVLLGLGILGLGFLIAMMAQVRSIIGRFLNFFNDDKKD